MTSVSEEIFASLEDLEPFEVAGYVVAEPFAPEYGGNGHKLHGLFNTQEQAHIWAEANKWQWSEREGQYAVMVVWAP